MLRKVLIVDDEADLELLIRQKFRKQIAAGELEFVFAHHGQDALDQLGADPTIDVVLSDINMPVMDGLTLLLHLNDVDRLMKAVIVSAYGDIQNIRTAMNRGAFDFLTKPIDFKDFEVTLHKTFQELEGIKKGLKAREELNDTLTVVREISSELQLGPLLERIIGTITKMLNAERSTLFLSDDKTRELYTEIGEGLGKTQIRLPSNRGIAGTVFSSGESINITDAYSDP